MKMIFFEKVQKTEKRARRILSLGKAQTDGKGLRCIVDVVVCLFAGESGENRTEIK